MLSYPDTDDIHAGPQKPSQKGGLLLLEQLAQVATWTMPFQYHLRCLQLVQGM